MIEIICHSVICEIGNALCDKIQIPGILLVAIPKSKLV